MAGRVRGNRTTARQLLAQLVVHESRLALSPVARASKVAACRSWGDRREARTATKLCLPCIRAFAPRGCALLTQHNNHRLFFSRLFEHPKVTATQRLVMASVATT